MYKFFSGCMALAPFVLIALGIGVGFSSIFVPTGADDYKIIFMFVSMALGLVVGLIDIIWFAILAFRMPGWSKEKKIVWALLLYFVNIPLFPVFWWMNIRKRSD